MAVYKGFSSFEFRQRRTFAITDIEAVKLDLLNHIFTRRGDRVMMPTFGTSIPDMVFEPLDDFTINTISSELEEVFRFDPRVELLNLEVKPSPETNSVVAGVRLRYVELNTVDTMNINIDVGGG